MTKPKCKKCKESKYVVHDMKYDAYHCLKCKIWVEDKCSDPNCEYCPSRPDKPRVG